MQPGAARQALGRARRRVGGRRHSRGGRADPGAAARRPAQNPFGAGLRRGGGRRRPRRFWRRQGNPGPFVLRRHLQRLARRRRKDRRHETAARDVGSGGRPDRRRAQEALRHGDGDARAAAPRDRGRDRRHVAQLAPARACEGSTSGKTDLPADSEDVNRRRCRRTWPRSRRSSSLQAGGRGFGGGGGGRGGGAADNLVARLAQAKNALMGGMWPTEASDEGVRGLEDRRCRRRSPRRTRSSRAPRRSAAQLTKHSLTLTAPTPVK